MVAAAVMDVRLLGPLEMDYRGAPIPLGATAQRALLSRLLLDANLTVSVDRLVDDLWGEDAPSTAVKMVQIHVSRLRKLLPPGLLFTRAPGYAVQIPPEALDVARVERLRERGRAELARGSAAEASRCLRGALALWRGPALAEFDLPFAAIESARLEELRLTCLEDRIDAELQLGLHASLVAELGGLVLRHPLRERLQRHWMLALYRSGRQADALAGYRQLRHTLATELGIEPSRELRDLERRVLRQDPTLDLATVEAPSRRGEPALWQPCAASPAAHRFTAASDAFRWTARRRSMRGGCGGGPHVGLS